MSWGWYKGTVGLTLTLKWLLTVEPEKANDLDSYKYLLLIFRDMPGVLFRQYPEFLEDYLPWSPEVQEACK